MDDLTGATGNTPDTLASVDMLTLAEHQEIADIMAANADSVYEKENRTEVDAGDTLTWGTKDNPTVTYIDPDGVVKIQPGATLIGYGILVIKGYLEVQDIPSLDAEFTYTGLIIIAGKEGSAKFRGRNNIYGGIMVGVDKGAGGAELELEDNTSVHYSCEALGTADAVFTTDKATFQTFSWREL